MSITSRGSAAFEDLTARARIRDAAVEHFAEYGVDRATIRGIARAARVSPGLVRHHFGSKDDLRKACDAYALDALRGYVDQTMTEEGLNDPRTLGEAWTPLHPFRRYLARALIDGSVAAGQIFDELVALTEQTLEQTDKHRLDPPVADLRTRAALMIAMALGIPAFRAHISRSIGADIFSPEGDRRITLALLDIHSHATITPGSAQTLRRGLGGAAGA
jgi:TetR/AcrR family transcriptional regulator, regulator of cefoperazone and chloramphenicol sensitivity